MIDTLRPIVGDRPLSIDTLNPNEIKAAVEHGIDMVLSLDHGNCEELLPYLAEKGVPSIDSVCDLVLDPVNSSSIVDSIFAYHDFHKVCKKPMFFGVGNVVELMDTDSNGANALLAGIAMELGASILFTPEESGKTTGSVRELSIASKMMFLAKQRKSIPKDLGIDLLVFKDKKRRVDLAGEHYDELPHYKSEEELKFVHDKAGSFKIRVEYGVDVESSKIVVVHFIRTKAQAVIEGRSAKEVYEEIIRKGLVSRLEHAAYLGSELQKAEIAMLTGKEYVQDFGLFKNPELKA